MSEKTSENLTRRALLKLSLGLSGVLSLFGLVKFLGYQSAPLQPVRFTLKTPAEYAAGSVTGVPEAQREYIALNAELAKAWPTIIEKKAALPDAEAWATVTGKRDELDRG